MFSPYIFFRAAALLSASASMGKTIRGAGVPTLYPFFTAPFPSDFFSFLSASSAIMGCAVHYLSSGRPTPKVIIAQPPLQRWEKFAQEGTQQRKQSSMLAKCSLRPFS